MPGMATEEPRQPLPPKPLAPAGDKRIVALQLVPDLRPCMPRFQQQYEPRSPSIVERAPSLISMIVSVEKLWNRIRDNPWTVTLMFMVNPSG